METKEGTFTQACKLVRCFVALGALKMGENVFLALVTFMPMPKYIELNLYLQQQRIAMHK